MSSSQPEDHIAVVNAGIGGNQIAGPAMLVPGAAWRGGPAAVDRLARDVLTLSGVRTVVWLEGINDFSENGGADAAAVLAAMVPAINRLREAGLKVIGATVPSALGSTRQGLGNDQQNARRRAFNASLIQAGIFDTVVDLDAQLTDPATGRMSRTNGQCRQACLVPLIEPLQGPTGSAKSKIRHTPIECRLPIWRPSYERHCLRVA